MLTVVLGLVRVCLRCGASRRRKRIPPDRHRPSLLWHQGVWPTRDGQVRFQEYRPWRHTTSLSTDWGMFTLRIRATPGSRESVRQVWSRLSQEERTVVPVTMVPP